MLGILTSLAAAAGGAAGKAVANEMIRTLKDIAGVQDAQRVLLDSLDRKLDLLVSGPFATGSLMLADAFKDYRPIGDRQHMLLESRKKFYEALGQETEPVRLSLAYLYLAVASLGLEQLKDVGPSLLSAHQQAVHGMRAEQREAQRGKTAEEMREWYRGSSVLEYCNGLSYTARAWGVPLSSAPLLLDASAVYRRYRPSEEPIPGDLESMRVRVLGEYHAFRSGAQEPIKYVDEFGLERAKIHAFQMREYQWLEFERKAKGEAPKEFEQALTELRSGELVDLNQDLPRLGSDPTRGQLASSTSLAGIIGKLRRRRVAWCWILE